MIGFEWQTVALYVAIGAVCAAVLISWHRNPRFNEFTLMDLVAEDGKLSARKFIEFGSWVVVTAAMVAATIRGTLTAEWIGIYTGVAVAARASGQFINLNAAANMRKVEMQRNVAGRTMARHNAEDDLSVEEVDARERK